MFPIDFGIIKFEPHANCSDTPCLTACVDALECYVSVTLGNDGLWTIDIDGDFKADEYPDEKTACMAAVGHLIVEAVDMMVAGPGSDIASVIKQAKLAKDWLNTLYEYLRNHPYGTQLPPTIQHALNSGDGSYRP